MKRKLKILVFFIVIILIILILQNKVEAESYSIENMNIEATIQDDGSVQIEQEITYKLSGLYSKIPIRIPFNLKDTENEYITKNNNIYNSNDVNIQNIVLENIEPIASIDDNFLKMNDEDFSYTEKNMDNYKEIELNSTSMNAIKTFKIYYTINNLCVKHNDIGELYYNFIDPYSYIAIKNLNINIYLPNNDSKIRCWENLSYNGELKIIDNKHVNFKVTDLESGKYIAIRMLFDTNNIINSSKESNIDAKRMVLNEEERIFNKKEGIDGVTKYFWITSFCLLIYWIILLFIFEKEKKYTPKTFDEDEIFKKYNPMIAGCIQGSRDILSRDIIAVILNLIDKGIIKLEIKSKNTFQDKKYSYLITKNTELEDNMDEIELFIYNWVFNEKNDTFLEERLEEMSGDADAIEKFLELNELAKKKFSELKVNETKVPKYIRIFNTVIFIFCIFFTFFYLASKGELLSDILHNYSNNYQLVIRFAFAMFIYATCLFPIFIFFLIMPFGLLIALRANINKILQKITGQKVVTTTICLFVFFGILMILTYFFIPFKYLIAPEALICILTIILLTDNLMLKHDPSMLEDYNKLNFFKNKIKNYSIMEDKDIEQVVLWGKYLGYAVSFGIADKLLNKIKNLNLDDDLINLSFDIEELIESINLDFYK